MWSWRRERERVSNWFASSGMPLLREREKKERAEYENTSEHNDNDLISKERTHKKKCSSYNIIEKGKKRKKEIEKLLYHSQI